MERFSSLCSHQIQRQVKTNKKTRGINIAAASDVYADGDISYFSKTKKKLKKTLRSAVPCGVISDGGSVDLSQINAQHLRRKAKIDFTVKQTNFALENLLSPPYSFPTPPKSFNK